MNPLGWTNFNLSPQGDGNHQHLLRCSYSMHFNLSPQGDGNIRSYRYPQQRCLDFNLSPQGDGNLELELQADGRSIDFNLSPQGDGHCMQPVFSIFLSPFQLIPARGQKNSASKMVRSFSFACLNFSVSVGFFSMNRAAAAFSLPWLLYCDKMCYNRAKLKHLSQNTQLYSSFVVQLFHNL